MKAPDVPKVSFPVAVAVGLNLIPLVGVVFWGWSAFALIFLYWLENVVIGVRTLLAILANGVLGGSVKKVGALIFATFFSFHYGLFCFVHGTFVLLLFGDGAMGDDLALAARELFAREPNLMIGFASIVAWQVVQFCLFIARGEAKTASPIALMGAPYPRIVVLHLAIIGGGFLVMLLNQPLAGLIILALVKMGFDVAEASGNGLRFGRPRDAGPGALSR